jgi:Cu+-exporting ATPase
VIPFDGGDADEALRMAAAVETASEHPVARAIAAAVEDPAPVRDFASVEGLGATGTVEGRHVVVGRARFLRERGLDVPPEEFAVVVGWDGKARAALVVADEVKPTSAAAVKALRDQGLRPILLTGDNEATARAVARKLGNDEVRADVLPQGKAEVIKALRAAGRRVAMAGDGVNDAPALAEADVGIAMGTGADVAIESAGITLVKGDLRGIVRARRLSQATLQNIRQNLFLAFVYNSLGVPIAAGILYPWTGLLLNPMIAAAAMSLSSVSVITNALRLRRATLEGARRS